MATPRPLELVRAAWLVVLIPAGLALGCSGSGSGGGTDGTTSLPPPASGPPVQLAQYCDRYVTIGCDAAEACDCFATIGGNRALCKVFLAETCAEDVRDPVVAGEYTFDAVRAGQCIAATQRIVADCDIDDGDVQLYLASHCDDFLLPARRAGEPCEDSDACVGELVCRDDRCVTLPPPGAACLDGDCAPGASCGVDEMCHAESLAGGPCGDGLHDCALDLYCDPRVDTCQRYLLAGESCGHASWACDGERDLFCDPRGATCRPYLSVGESCDGATWACDDDLTCRDDTRVCAPYPGVGQPCDAHEGCDDDLFCDGASRCRAQLPGGAACDDDEQCASWDCDDGTCAAKEADVCGAL